MANPTGNLNWKKGESANPKGKPKGVEHRHTKIRNAFFKAFETMGERRLLMMAKKDPVSFYRIVASLIPKQIADENGNVITPQFGSVQILVKLVPPTEKKTIDGEVVRPVISDGSEYKPECHKH